VLPHSDIQPLYRGPELAETLGMTAVGSCCGPLMRLNIKWVRRAELAHENDDQKRYRLKKREII
jgi:hypothetical protein